MSSDWVFNAGEYTCGLRTVGVLVCNNKLLVQREKHGDEYALPGGAVQAGETTEEALVREYQEEIGIAVVVKRLIWTEETFWTYHGRKQHGIVFYYLIDAAETSEIADTGVFISQKDNANVVWGWMPLDEITTMTLYPRFLKTEIGNIDGSSRHFISREEYAVPKEEGTRRHDT